MIKLILYAFIVLATTLTGNSFSQRLSNRCKCLVQVVESINVIRSLVSFSAVDIYSAVQKSFGKSAFGNAFVMDSSESAEFHVWWKDSVSSIDKSTGFTPDDKELLLKLGEGLGVTDIGGQISHLDLYSELFSQRLNEAKDNEKEKSKLYRILGFSLGCTVTLIVV